MVVFPKAKINLGLNITRKRPDGYHDIETLFYPVDLFDALEFVISPDQEGGIYLTSTGINSCANSDDNLVIKTINILRKKFSFPL